MYRNLIAEMRRRGITADDISRVIGKKRPHGKRQAEW